MQKEQHTNTPRTLASLFADTAQDHVVASYNTIARLASGVSVNYPMLDLSGKSPKLRVTDEWGALYEITIVSRFLCEITRASADMCSPHRVVWERAAARAVWGSFDANRGMNRAMHHYQQLMMSIRCLEAPTEYWRDDQLNCDTLRQSLDHSVATQHVRVTSTTDACDLTVERQMTTSAVMALSYEKLAKYLQRLMNNHEVKTAECRDKTPCILHYDTKGQGTTLETERVLHTDEIILHERVVLSAESDNVIALALAVQYANG